MTELRHHFYDQLQDTVPQDDVAEVPEGSHLMGYVVVSEWMTPEGERWLWTISGDPQGDQVPSWVRDAYVHFHFGGED